MHTQYRPHTAHCMLENESAPATDDGWTMVQSKSAKEPGLIVTRLARQVRETMNELKQGHDPFTKKDHFTKQGKTYAAIVMAKSHGRDQDDHVRDYFYDKGSETAKGPS